MSINNGTKTLENRYEPPSFSLDGVNSPIGKRARLVGSHSAIIPAGTTVDIDYQMEQMQYQGVDKDSIFNGIQYYAKNADNMDTITYQVIDKDNVLGYGAGTILDEFGSGVFVMPDAVNDILLYKARIIPGLYIRVIYISTGSVDVRFSMNLFRHLLE